MKKRATLVLVALLLVAVTAAVYAPVRGFAFVNYDDRDYVYANALVTGGWTAKSVMTAFVTFHAGNWHPLTWLSHMTDVQFFGLDAGRHHLVNLLIHLLNVLLLFALMVTLTRAPWRSAIVAALFALHPLNVETVAWISERKSLLSTTAWLLAIACYARWTSTKSVRHYLLLVACFVLGLMSKPMIVTLPAMLFAIDVWPLGRLAPSDFSSREGWRRAGTLLYEKLPLFALSVGASAATLLAQTKQQAVASGNLLPLVERVLNASISFTWYLANAFVPTNLAVLHPHPATLNELVSRGSAFFSLALALTLLGLSVRFVKAAPYMLAGLLWYVITLLPVIGIIQVGLQAHADRYAYVPLIGVFFAVTWLIADASRHLRAELPVAVIATLLIASGTYLTRQQVYTWRDSGTLFRQALEAHDGRNPVASHNLMSHHTFTGDALKKAGGYAAAAVEFQRALQYAPNSPTAIYNYAAVLTDLERYSEALPYYRRSLAADPTQPDAWLYSGDALTMLGRYSEAAEAYRRALSLRSNDKFAEYGLAYSAARAGDSATATSAVARLHSLDPALARQVVAQLQ